MIIKYGGTAKNNRIVIRTTIIVLLFLISLPIQAHADDEKPDKSGDVYLDAPKDMKFEKVGGNVIRRESEEIYTERRMAEMKKEFAQFKSEIDLRLKTIEEYLPHLGHSEQSEESQDPSAKNVLE